MGPNPDRAPTRVYIDTHVYVCMDTLCTCRRPTWSELFNNTSGNLHMPVELLRETVQRPHLPLCVVAELIALISCYKIIGILGLPQSVQRPRLPLCVVAEFIPLISCHKIIGILGLPQ